MRSSLVASCLLAMAVGAAGCKSLKTGATEHFARDYSCPEDRVVAKERSDIAGSSLFAGPPTGAPPAEVKSDPGRLAKWQADRAKEQKTMSDVYDSFTVFEVSGCDHEAFYACIHPAKVNGGADPVSCTPAQHPPK